VLKLEEVVGFQLILKAFKGFKKVEALIVKVHDFEE